jgi:hypothetical protein
VHGGLELDAVSERVLVELAVGAVVAGDRVVEVVAALGVDGFVRELELRGSSGIRVQEIRSGAALGCGS